MTLKKHKEPMIRPGIEPKVKIKYRKEQQKVREADQEIREYENNHRRKQGPDQAR